MTAVDEKLLRYLAFRDQQRADDAAAFLATLTPDETALVREGAVAGYGLGYRFGAANPGMFRDVPFPHDVDIVAVAFAAAGAAVNVVPGRRDYWLFREAAVMGFVLGDRHGGVDARAGRLEAQPPAEHVVTLVVQHCQSTSDLYPVIGRDVAAMARKVLRSSARPLPRAHLVDALVMVLAEESAQVDSVLDGLVSDEELVETADGISLPAVDE